MGNFQRLGRSAAAAIMLFAAFMQASCTQGADLPELSNPAPGPYRLGVGDRLRVITVGADQLTAEFRVGDGGSIAVPLLGDILAAGRTPAELASAITARLEEKRLFRNPSVVVEITDYRPIDVLGEVNRPGEYPYRPGMTLLAAVSVAGGFSYRAVTGHASIVRTTGPQTSIEGRVGRGSFVQPGDVITIYERQF